MFDLFIIDPICIYHTPVTLQALRGNERYWTLLFLRRHFCGLIISWIWLQCCFIVTVSVQYEIVGKNNMGRVADSIFIMLFRSLIRVSGITLSAESCRCLPQSIQSLKGSALLRTQRAGETAAAPEPRLYRHFDFHLFLFSCSCWSFDNILSYVFVYNCWQNFIFNSRTGMKSLARRRGGAAAQRNSLRSWKTLHNKHKDPTQPHRSLMAKIK